MSTNDPTPSRTRLIQRAVATCAFFLAILFGLSPPGQALARWTTDLWFYLRGPLPHDQRIVLVAIDEASFGVLEKQWPWPRSWHARLVDRLFEDGAAAVALDIVFADPSEAADDLAMAEMLSRRSPVVLGAQIDRSRGAGYARQVLVGPPEGWLNAGVRLGHTHLPLDADGFIRRLPLPEDRDLIPFSTAAVIAGCPTTAPPASTHGLIPYLGPPGSVPTVSYYQALLPGHLPKGYFKDKQVFIGFVAQGASSLDGQPDHYPTPYSRWGYGYMAGVEIQAQLAHGICAGRLIQTARPGWALGLHTLLWLMGGILFFRVAPARGSLIWLLGSGLALGSAYCLFAFAHTAWPVSDFVVALSAIYLARLLLYAWANHKEKRFIRRAFATYVSPELVAQLIRERKKLDLGGIETEITAFFSDIQGFTTISERLSPGQLVALLNEYLTEMTDILLAHGGTVDKFEGDAIVAFFGAPTPRPDHAEAACRCALTMQARLAQLEKAWSAQGRPALPTRIGLCSGPAVVGNMGSKNRLDYTMMGDTPNTAARLEGANKIYGTTILVGDSTAQAAPGFRFRQIDRLRLKGKTTPLRVFEPMGPVDQIGQTHQWLIENYAKAWQDYEAGNWQAAADGFEWIRSTCPEDRPTQVMLARCEQFASDPPPDWEGIFTMTVK